MAIVSRPATQEYRDNWPFGDKPKKKPEVEIDRATVEAVCAYLRTEDHFLNGGLYAAVAIEKAFLR
jgi:hypothetical protein